MPTTWRSPDAGPPTAARWPAAQPHRPGAWPPTRSRSRAEAAGTTAGPLAGRAGRLPRAPAARASAPTTSGSAYGHYLGREQPTSGCTRTTSTSRRWPRWALAGLAAFIALGAALALAARRDGAAARRPCRARTPCWCPGVGAALGGLRWCTARSTTSWSSHRPMASVAPGGHAGRARTPVDRASRGVASAGAAIVFSHNPGGAPVTRDRSIEQVILIEDVSLMIARCCWRASCHGAAGRRDAGAEAAGRHAASTRICCCCTCRRGSSPPSAWASTSMRR